MVLYPLEMEVLYGFIWFYMVLWENHGNIWGYPLVNIQTAIENGPVEIVDLPIDSMVIFYSYVKLPEGHYDQWPFQEPKLEVPTT